MSTAVTISTFGRVTADLELKTSQNGKNTTYVQFSLAVNKGYGDNEHPNFYQCILYGVAAERIVVAKVKKASVINVVGDLDLVEYTRPDGSKTIIPKITLYDWSYTPTNKPKTDAENTGEADESNDGFETVPLDGNGLPFN